MNKAEILVVGAGINGLVAANYLQRDGCALPADGYVNATPPSIAEAKQVLGATLTELWISGTPGYMCSQQLLRHASLSR